MFNKKVWAVIVIGCIILSSGVIAYHADEIYISSKNLVTANIPEKLFSNAQSSMLVIAHDIDGNPQKEEVRIDLVVDDEKITLYEGKMDESGFIKPSFMVPNITGNGEIIITVGNQKIIEDVGIVDTHKILLTTDKPLYQPGQTIHIRLLLYEGIIPVASQHNITLEIADPEGNLIYKKILQPNEYGLANLDFPLSDQLPLGNYEITATVAGEKTQRVVMVKKYVLPKFRIDLQDMKSWYLVDEHLRGTVSCNYFFGKPVEGNVTIAVFRYLGVWEPHATINGRLNDGELEFTIDPIRNVVGIPIQGGQGIIQFQITVEDTGGHKENKTHIIPIANNSIIMTTLADSNVKGVNSTYYVIARDPAGQPIEDAHITLTLDNTTLNSLLTDDRGVASFDFLYTGQMKLQIEIVKENQQETAFYEINGDAGIKTVPEKSKYTVGEFAKFQVYYTGDAHTDWVYYDVISKGFVTTTGRLQLHEGKGNFSFMTTPDMIPLPKIRVYKIQENLNVIKDTAIIGVSPSDNLTVTITKDKDTYAPHENITLGFTVQNGSNPIVAALGVSIVDKSVFEISERFTGLEKIYYELEEEFITPQYEIHEYIFSNDSFPLIVDDNVQEVRKSDFGSEGNLVLNNPEKYRDEAQLFREKSIFAYWMTLLIGFIITAVIVLSFFFIKIFGKTKIVVVTAAFGLCIFSIITFIIFDQAFTDDAITTPGLGWGENFENEDPLRAADTGLDDAKIGAPEAAGGDTASDQAPPQLRRFFPETWYWNPMIITDENGYANITLVTPDSITTWNIEAISSTIDAQIGVEPEEITVFKEFFVEPDIPISAIRGDQFPLNVLIYNYGKDTSTVRVQLVPDAWYKLLSQNEQVITVQPNSVTNVAFTIQPTHVGTHNVTIYAFTNEDSDAIIKPIRIDPDGKPVTSIENGELRDNQTTTSFLLLSPERISGSENAFIKLQGGIESVIMDGAEGFLNFVSGCGEQSMSLLAIDILAYENLLKKEGITTEQLFESETIITQGIQHELMYLVTDGNGRGIVWFPHDQGPHPWLTSWGLITFQDAKRTGFTIDQTIIHDMQTWLIDKQEKDGSFTFPEWGLYETTNPILQMKKVATTAYITRALLYSGYDNNDAITKSLAYIQEHITNHWNDSYTLALSLIALEDGNGNKALRDKIATQLINLKIEENGTTYWAADNTMYANSENRYWGRSTHTIETTAYAVMALQKKGGHGQTIKEAISYLLNHRSMMGGFSSTQDTIVAMQALNGQGSIEVEEMTVLINVNENAVDTITFTEENKDVTYLIDLRPHLEESTTVHITSTGKGSILYQIYSEQYLPWELVNIETPQELHLEVNYDATTIHVDDLLLAHVDLMYNGSAESVRMVLIDLRAPVGFSFVPQDFELLLENDLIDNYEIKGRQALVYVESLERGVLVSFDYHLLANQPIKGTIQGVKAFDMYNPVITAETEPVEIVSQ